MYKPLIVFSENCNQYKDSAAYRFLANEGWTIYAIPSNYDGVTAKVFAEEAKAVGAEKLGILVENSSDTLLDFIYEDCGSIIDIDVFGEDTFRLTEGDVQAQAQAQPTAPGSAPVADNVWDSTNKTIGLYLAYNEQHFVNVRSLYREWQALGPSSGSYGFIKRVKDENMGKTIDQSNYDTSIQANSRSTDELLNIIGITREKGVGASSNFGVVLNGASSKRETPWINTRILAISPSESLNQCLPNKTFENMMNSFNGTPFIPARTSGNTSIIVDTQTPGPGIYGISDEIVAEVSKKRDNIINFIYILDPSSTIQYNPSRSPDPSIYNYFIKVTDPTPGNDLSKVASYINRTLSKSGFVNVQEATVRQDNLKFKAIVQKIIAEISAPEFKPKVWHTSASQAAANIQNGVTYFVNDCTWLNDIRNNKNVTDISDEDLAAQKELDKIEKLKQKANDPSARDGFLINSIRDIGNAFNIQSYKDTAELLSSTRDKYGLNRYEAEAQERELRAALSGTNLGIAKSKDPVLLMKFLGADAFDEFATLICPDLWQQCKDSVYKNTAFEDKKADEQKDNKSSDTEQKDKEQNKPVDTTDDAPNFFPTESKDENKF